MVTTQLLGPCLSTARPRVSAGGRGSPFSPKTKTTPAAIVASLETEVSAVNLPASMITAISSSATLLRSSAKLARAWAMPYAPSVLAGAGMTCRFWNITSCEWSTR